MSKKQRGESQAPVLHSLPPPQSQPAIPAELQVQLQLLVQQQVEQQVEPLQQQVEELKKKLGKKLDKSSGKRLEEEQKGMLNMVC